MIGALILVFPTIANLITHSSSVILTLLALLGLPICLTKKNRPKLTYQEKLAMLAFVAYLKYGMSLAILKANILTQKAVQRDLHFMQVLNRKSLPSCEFKS